MTSTEPSFWEADDELLPVVVEPLDRGALVPLAELTERARAYARSSKAANTGPGGTRRDLRHFGGWCEARVRSGFAVVAASILRVSQRTNPGGDDANRYGEVVQRRQGLWIHHPR